jgi:hypothetical protein
MGRLNLARGHWNVPLGSSPDQEERPPGARHSLPNPGADDPQTSYSGLAVRHPLVGFGPCQVRRAESSRHNRLPLQPDLHGHNPEASRSKSGPPHSSDQRIRLPLRKMTFARSASWAGAETYTNQCRFWTQFLLERFAKVVAAMAGVVGLCVVWVSQLRSREVR